MGLLRGVVFRHGEKLPTEMPTSTMALVGRFPSLMGRSPGALLRFRPGGPFYLLKIHWKTAY